MTIILSSLNRFFKKIFTGKFLGKFVVKWILALPLHLARLPCETSMSAKQVINDKLQCIPVAEDVTLAARSADISLLSGFLVLLCSLTRCLAPAPLKLRPYGVIQICLLLLLLLLL